MNDADRSAGIAYHINLESAIEYGVTGIKGANSALAHILVLSGDVKDCICLVIERPLNFVVKGVKANDFCEIQNCLCCARSFGLRY